MTAFVCGWVCVLCCVVGVACCWSVGFVCLVFGFDDSVSFVVIECCWFS